MSNIVEFYISYGKYSGIKAGDIIKIIDVIRKEEGRISPNQVEMNKLYRVVRIDTCTTCPVKECPHYGICIYVDNNRNILEGYPTCGMTLTNKNGIEYRGDGV